MPTQSKPHKSTMAACRTLRKTCGKHTPAQRASSIARAMALINEGAAKSAPFKLDPVLEGQLKALACAFNVTKSRHYGPLLHIGPPDCFWTQPERLMLTVRAFYPLADFALSDAEGCTSIALSGKNAATLSRLTKRGRK